MRYRENVRSGGALMWLFQRVTGVLLAVVLFAHVWLLHYLISGSLDFAAKVLQEAHVAVVPGEAFGCDDNVRLSFATSMEQIRKGLDRVEELLGKK